MTDQQRALRLLAHHKRGYSVHRAMRSMIRRYAVSGTVCLMIVFAAWSLRRFEVMTLFIGLYAGMLVRDIGWFVGVRGAWAFAEKVTDWAKVEAIAAGRPPPDADHDRA